MEMERKDDVNQVTDNNQRLCGGCGRYPSFLKRFANPRYFLLTFCLQNVIQGASTSYFVGVETSLEKHFHFSSKDFGLLIVLAEIGPITTSLILSYLGGKGNRPRWLCAGMTITAIGLLITFTTLFIYPPPTITESGKLSNSKKYCSMSRQFGNATVGPPSDPQNLEGVDDLSCYESNSLVFFVWFFSYSLLGIGGMVVYCIGGPYLDDGIKKNDSPLYFAIIIAVKIMGPFVGFAVSAGFLRSYVIPGGNHGISSLDPRWIGAWWGGTLLFSFLNLVVGLIICLFPRDMSIVQPVLKKESSSSPSVASTYQIGSEYGTIDHNKDVMHKTNDIELLVTDKEEVKPIYKDFASSMKRLAKNKTLVLTATTDVFAVTGILGFFIWLPKYLEHQFRIDKSESALYTGLAGTSSVIIGVLGGGILIRQCQPSAKTLVILCASCKAIYIASLVGLMFITCNFNDDFPGYYNNKSGNLKVTFPCSDSCSCDLKEFIPVCLREKHTNKSQTFFSPCHAGCPVPNDVNIADEINLPHLQENFSNCLCSSSPSSNVTLGYCEKTCSMFTVYNLVNVIIKSFISVGAIGNLLLNLRCVDPKDKAIALGLKGTMIALGLLIAPLVFGALADSSCILWEEACGKTGSCWVYDTQDFSYKLHGGCLGFFLISLICDIVLSQNVSHVILTDGPLHGDSDRRTSLNGTSVSSISLNSNSTVEPFNSGTRSTSLDGSLARKVNP
ncbi:UNVERIFIED_CONTAM: hypothetical protein RMT77_013049 [Armadillidium vulgare]